MEWKVAWSYLPIHYNTVIGTVENITQKTQITTNVSGTKVKIKFSNRYGTEPLVLEKVVLRNQRDAKSEAERSVEVTYQGQTKIILPPYDEFYSDELSFQVEAGESFTIFVFLKEKTNIMSACATWSAKSWHTVYGLGGDYSEQEEVPEKKSCEIYPFIDADIHKPDLMVGICEVCVETGEPIQTIVLFGDSITHMSYYYDALLERLIQEAKGRVTLINCGIGGNRILREATYLEDADGNGSCFGEAGITRLEEDVFANRKVDAVIVLEGINDILHPFLFQHPKERVSAKELAKGLEEMVNIIHRYKAKAYLGTLMPFLGEETEGITEGEMVRTQLNEWIKHQTCADGILDFARATQQKQKPEYMEEDYHIGDGLHPGSEGGRRMAAAIPSEWFV